MRIIWILSIQGRSEQESVLDSKKQIMLRRYKSFILAAALLPALASCKKDFFDLNPYDALPVEDATKTVADLNVVANGMYAGLRYASATGAAGGLYGRTLPIKGDLAADNLYLKNNNSGRYLAFRDFNQTVADGEATQVWVESYDVIKRANTVINTQLASSAAVDQLRGEALAVRALMHFELVRNFAIPYTVAPNGLGVPIVTEFSQNSRPARNTTAEVYTQIISDLNEAFNLMSLNQGESMKIPGTNTVRVSSSGYFTKYAAKALLARVYQTMGDWEKTRDAALDVVNNSGFQMINWEGFEEYFADPSLQTDRVETLFEVASDGTSHMGTNSLSNFYDPAGYGDVFVTNELYNLYSATDVRRDLIVPVGTNPTVYQVIKYPNTTNAAEKDDTKVLRYSDVVLTLAEAYANLNDNANALLWLNRLVAERDPSAPDYASTGAQLREDILTERRKELAFEGHRYWDLMRLNLPITGHIKSQNPFNPFPIEVTNTRRIFPIPQQELDVNENIRGQQNPGY